MRIVAFLLFSLVVMQPVIAQVAKTPPTSPEFLRCGDGKQGYGLHWIDKSTDETQFKVYQAINRTDGPAVIARVKSTTSGTEGTEYFYPVDTASGNYYTYAVTAENKYGESMSSNVTILPKKPAGFAAGSDSISVFLKWTYPADSWITMVFVERSTNPTDGFAIMSPVVTQNGVVFIDYTAERNVDYYYRIRGAFFDSRSKATSYTLPTKTVGPFRVAGFTKDFDGEFSFGDRNYKYRKFGNQTWMTENLAYLPEVHSSGSVSTAEKRYYVYGYEGSDVSAAAGNPNYKTYGVLYNWQAAADGTIINPADSIGVQGICPDGWHLPSNKEWLGLRGSLGLAKATRDSAFLADAIRKNIAAGSTQPAIVDMAIPEFIEYKPLAGGFLDSAGFASLGEAENYWSSTSRIQADRDYQSADANKGAGFSVRCLKGAALPTVQTGEILVITEKTAQPSGLITNDGGTPVTERGVLWSTLESNDLVFNRTSCGSGDGAFNCSLASLAEGTIYFVRAFATNSVGTAYGELKQFTTAGQGALPTVLTREVSEVLSISAAVGGNFTTYGGSAITARGICWGTKKKPTTSDSKAVSVAGLATFTGYLAGLEPKTTYYARAYATNSFGTTYGSEVQFTTTEKPQDGYFQADGRKYAYTTIGAQTWMAENLAHLPAVSPLALESRDKPVYYVYGYEGTNVDSAKATANYQTYGVLYNWIAATTACPTGWHLPSHTEMNTLISYLTNYGYAYGGAGRTIAKSVASPSGWETFPLPGTVGANPELNNRSGFNTLSAGQRIIAAADQANGMGRVGIFWSSSVYGREEKYAYSLAVIYSNNLLQPYPTDKRHGFSIRCLRD